MIQILIVEDDWLIAESLKLAIQSEDWQVAGVAHNAQDAFKILEDKKIDFAVLDVDLSSSLTGMDVAKLVHQQYQIPFIFLTAFDDNETIEAAQSYSPYGYLVKPFQERSLVTTIKLALANANKISNKTTLNKSYLDSLVVGELTEREFELIKELASGKSYNKIAEASFISVNTVKFHVKNIYLKFEVSSRAELIAKIL